MRITWVSNAPWAPTGYGTQTAEVVPRLQAAGHSVVVASNFGLVGAAMEWNGIPVLPQGKDAYSNDMAPAHHRQHRSDWMITLYDAWVFKRKWFPERVVSWLPVDHEPVPPHVSQWAQTVRPVAMSRFGQKMLRDQGIDSAYIPHSINTRDVFTPRDTLSNGAKTRKLLGVPDDAFLVMINAANKGQTPPRKAWAEMYTALGFVMRELPDLHVYVHTDKIGHNGVDLDILAQACGVDPKRLVYADAYSVANANISQQRPRRALHRRRRATHAVDGGGLRHPGHRGAGVRYAGHRERLQRAAGTRRRGLEGQGPTVLGPVPGGMVADPVHQRDRDRAQGGAPRQGQPRTQGQGSRQGSGVRHRQGFPAVLAAAAGRDGSGAGSRRGGSCGPEPRRATQGTEGGCQNQAEGGMTRVLLTGISGFVGHHIAEHILKTTDWQVVGIASFRHRGDSARVEQLGEWYAKSDWDRVRVHLADMSAPIGPTLINQIGPVDYIINAAAQSHVDRSISDPRPFIENNVSVAISMLEYAREVQPKAFIQVSTDEVYGPAAEGDYSREWDAIVPSNPYAASKAAQEAIAISYWRTYGVPVVLTNTMNMFGERQDGEKFIPLLIRSVLRGEEVTIHRSYGKVGSRFYLHARNFADALVWLLGREPSRWSGETGRPDRYNIGGEVEISNLDLALKIANLVGEPLQYTEVDFAATRPGHDRRYALDSAKIREAGWQQPVNFDDSLCRTVRWTLDHPEWLG